MGSHDTGRPAPPPEVLHAAALELLRDMGEVVVVRDERRRIYVSEAAQEVSGYSAEELAAMPSLFDLVVPEQQERVRADGRQGGVHEMTIVRKDGRLVDLEVHRKEFIWGGNTYIVSLARDVTLRKRAEAELRQQALHDPLTALPNRALFEDRLELALAETRRDGVPVAALLMDLDDFKQVNDGLGHHAGDALLAHLAPRLAGAVRESDTVARIGGDEFGIILPGADGALAGRAAKRLLRACAQPLVVEGHPLTVGASVGIAVAPDDGDDVSAVLRAADIAMYEAKLRRTHVARYAPERRARATDRVELSSQLRAAIASDQLVVHYQPLVSLAQPLVLGVEALVRWRHPERGLLPPDAFIPLAERAGLMRPLTLAVTRAALAQYRAWHEAGVVLPVLVNYSARDLLDRNMLRTIRALHDEFRVSDRWLKVEITESLLVEDPELAVRALDRLHELGVLVAIDDFGTGYSSLSYLVDLPVDAVKIDRSFVHGLVADDRKRTIVRAIVELAHGLGFRVAAEGVEDAAALGILRELGCDMAQGFAIARPLPARAFDSWLATSGYRARPAEPKIAFEAR